MEGLYYPCSENKGADQLRGYREADLRLCFCICKKPVFSLRGSFSDLYYIMVRSHCILGIYQYFGEFQDTCSSADSVRHAGVGRGVPDTTGNIRKLSDFKKFVNWLFFASQ